MSRVTQVASALSHGIWRAALVQVLAFLLLATVVAVSSGVLAGSVGRNGGLSPRRGPRPRSRFGRPVRRSASGRPGEQSRARAGRGHGRHPGRQGLLAGRLRRRDLHLRRRPLLGLRRGARPRRAHRGHGLHPGRQGLLAGRLGRRVLHLRRRRVLWIRRSAPPGRALVGMASTPDGKGYWLVASDGGIFSLWRRPFFGFDGDVAARRADRGHGRHPDGKGLWDGRLGRRDLHLWRRSVPGLRQVVSSLARAVVAWRRRRTARATAPPRTAGSSTSVTPRLGLRKVAPTRGTRPWVSLQHPKGGGAPGRRSGPSCLWPGRSRIDPGHNGGNSPPPRSIDQPIWNGQGVGDCDTTGTADGQRLHRSGVQLQRRQLPACGPRSRRCAGW